MKNYFIFPITIAILSISLLASCKKNACSNSVKATFRDATGTGGCGMVIELKNEIHLEPRNLSEMNITAKDGMKIWLSYTVDNSGGTNCMMGDKVFIDCIVER